MTLLHDAPSPEELLAEDMARFFYDPLGFVLYAFNWGEGDLAGHDGPDEWQREFLEEVGRQVRERDFDGVRPVVPQLHSTSSGHGIGKSATVSWLILWIMSTRPHCKGVVTANTAVQLSTKTWAELAKWRKRCITGHWFTQTANPGNMKLVHVDHPETWRVDAQTCREENSESFAGLHAANSSPFYIFDEASAVPDKIWEVAEGGLTDGEPFWFAFGNPTRNSGRFHKTFNGLRHRWTTRKVDSRSARMTNKTLIERWRQDYGEDSDFFKVRVRGEFPSASSAQLIATDLVDQAAARDLVPPTPTDPIIIGVDVARFGEDCSVIRVRQGRDARTHKAIRLQGRDTMQVAAHVARLANQLLPDAICVDGGGVGGGVIDRLRQLQIPNVFEIQFGAKAPDNDARNMAAWMWCRMRDAMPGLCIPDEDALKTDLTSREYFFDQNDKLMLESKEDMKARGLASPDDGDALALTFAVQTGPRNIERTRAQVHGLGYAGATAQAIGSDYDPHA